MKLIITTCDVCNPNQNNHNDGVGVCVWPPRETIKSFGWLRVVDGSGFEKHICRECRDRGITKLPLKRDHGGQRDEY